MKKTLTLFLFVVVMAAAFSQQTAVQWEYLTVCFGKTYFNDAEKSLLYFGDDVLPDEGTNLQKKLDILGTHGWEVVNIVGTIGGDQQILLKRIYNAEKSENEQKKLEKLKKERADKQLREFIEYVEEQARLVEEERQKGALLEEAASKKEKLIDRDELDSWEIQKIRLAEQEALRKQELESDEQYILAKFDAYEYPHLIKEKQRTENGFVLTLNFDLTDQYLLNTNQYRKSETQKFANDRIAEIPYNQRMIKHLSVFVTVKCYITYNNQNIEVGTASSKTYPYNPDK